LAAVTVEGVGEELGRPRDGDALAVLELVEPDWMPRLRCQNWQSAAPPAMVPSRNGLISITFLTVCDEMSGPWDARESTATTTPCS